jgi:hypothetical protein
MVNVKSIRLDRSKGQIACFEGTTEIFSVDNAKLKVDSEIGLLNYIKHCGSIGLAIEQIKIKVILNL